MTGRMQVPIGGGYSLTGAVIPENEASRTVVRQMASLFRLTPRLGLHSTVPSTLAILSIFCNLAIIITHYSAIGSHIWGIMAQLNLSRGPPPA